ncbi:hypothetical protein ACFX2B_000304 [Malus domestica]
MCKIELERRISVVLEHVIVGNLLVLSFTYDGERLFDLESMRRILSGLWRRGKGRPDYFLSFFRSHRFSATQISKMVRSCSRLFQLYPEMTILPKLEFFTSLGVQMKTLQKLWSINRSF